MSRLLFVSFLFASLFGMAAMAAPCDESPNHTLEDQERCFEEQHDLDVSVGPAVDVQFDEKKSPTPYYGGVAQLRYDYNRFVQTEVIAGGVSSGERSSPLGRFYLQLDSGALSAGRTSFLFRPVSLDWNPRMIRWDHDLGMRIRHKGGAVDLTMSPAGLTYDLVSKGSSNVSRLRLQVSQRFARILEVTLGGHAGLLWNLGREESSRVSYDEETDTTTVTLDETLLERAGVPFEAGALAGFNVYISGKGRNPVVGVIGVSGQFNGRWIRFKESAPNFGWTEPVEKDQSNMNLTTLLRGGVSF